MTRQKYIEQLLYLLYGIFFISMVCAFRAISSITIVLIIITSFVKNKQDTGSFICLRLKNNLLIAACIFYLTQALLLFFSANHSQLYAHLLLKSAIIFVPLMVCCGNFINAAVVQKMMKYFILVIALAMLFCLLTAVYKYVVVHAPSDVFFYHALVAPFNQHAVQVAILVFIGLVHLLEQVKRNNYVYNAAVHFFMLFYFSVLIMLLSSKLVIGFMLLAFIYYFIIIIRTTATIRLASLVAVCAAAVLILLVLLVPNKISNRFSEIMNGNMRLVSQPKFDPSVYFNGVQFRLLQGRFVKEILTEKQAWLTGVSGDAQNLLDKKYIATNMYVGNRTGNDTGYLGYNTHDQFLESTLQSGLPGLAAFLLICFAMVQLVFKGRSRELFFVTILLLAYCFNESVLERQYSITIFFFFPLFFYYGVPQIKSAKETTLFQ